MIAPLPSTTDRIRAIVSGNKPTLVVALIVAIAVIMLMQMCHSSTVNVHTAKVTVPIAPIDIVGTTAKPYHMLPYTTGDDSSEVRSLLDRVLRERDSLRRVLRQYGVSSGFRLDTVYVHADGSVDSIVIDCDEVNRIPHLQARFSDRIAVVQLPVRSEEVGLTMKYVVEAGMVYNFTRFDPVVGAGIQLSLNDAIAIVGTADVRIQESTINAGLRATLRVTY